MATSVVHREDLWNNEQKQGPQKGSLTFCARPLSPSFSRHLRVCEYIHQFSHSKEPLDSTCVHGPTVLIRLSIVVSFCDAGDRLVTQSGYIVVLWFSLRPTTSAKSVYIVSLMYIKKDVIGKVSTPFPAFYDIYPFLLKRSRTL